MKIRNSFVGNSSTCSFIAAVIKVADSKEDFAKKFEGALLKSDTKEK